MGIEPEIKWIGSLAHRMSQAKGSNLKFFWGCIDGTTYTHMGSTTVGSDGYVFTQMGILPIDMNLNPIGSMGKKIWQAQ